MDTEKNGKKTSETGETYQVEACPSCGMLKRAWKGNQGEGYEIGGEIYCCRGCAEGAGCSCEDES